MNRVVEFRKADYTALNPEEAELLRAIGCKVEDEPKSYSTYKAWIEDVVGLPFAVTIQPSELSGDAVDLIFRKLGDIEGKLRESAPHTPTFNEKVQVHVPGLGLLLIDEVKVLVDQCTDGLQEMLNDGWRIIAACPQSDQRRPDYVIGRTKTP